MTPDGFLGRDRRVVHEVRLDAGHTHLIRVVEYTFAEFDGTGAPTGVTYPGLYIEIEERGPHYTGARLVALTDAVHALLNLGETELWQVGNRAVDYRGRATVNA